MGKLVKPHWDFLVYEWYDSKELSSRFLHELFRELGKSKPQIFQNNLNKGNRPVRLYIHNIIFRITRKSTNPKTSFICIDIPGRIYSNYV
jgi:hypothetical protein